MYDPELGPDPAMYRGLLLPEAVRLERLDDTWREVAHIVQDFNDRYPIEREPWCDGEKNLAGGHFSKYSVVGCGWPAGHIHGDYFEGVRVEVKPDLICRNCSGGGHINAQKVFCLHDGDVLISDVEVVHGAQQIVAPDIGLEASDDILDRVRGLLHFGLKFTLEPGSVFPKGEIYLFGLDPAQRYEVICEDIEGRSEVMDCISENNREFSRNNAPISEVERYPFMIAAHVLFEHDRARIILKVGGNFTLKLC